MHVASAPLPALVEAPDKVLAGRLVVHADVAQHESMYSSMTHRIDLRGLPSCLLPLAQHPPYPLTVVLFVTPSIAGFLAWDHDQPGEVAADDYTASGDEMEVRLTVGLRRCNVTDLFVPTIAARSPRPNPPRSVTGFSV